MTGVETGLDFADALRVASAEKADRFLTFDRTLARRTARIVRAPRAQLRSGSLLLRARFRRRFRLTSAKKLA